MRGPLAHVRRANLAPSSWHRPGNRLTVQANELKIKNLCKKGQSTQSAIQNVMRRQRIPLNLSSGVEVCVEPSVLVCDKLSIAGLMDLEAGSSSAQPPPGPSSNSLEVNALRRRLASLELQLSQASSGLVPLPVQYTIMPGAKVPADRPRPEVAPAIFAAMRDSGMLPRAMPLHLLVISDNIEERRKVNALAREQNERPHAVCSLRVHEAMDVDQAVSLIRSGVLCHIVFFCIHAKSLETFIKAPFRPSGRFSLTQPRTTER